MAPESTWIVVADGALARFFVRTRPELPLEELDLLRVTAQQAHRLSKQAGSVPDGPNHRHRGRLERHDGHDADEHEFLAHIAGRINLMEQQSDAARFVICASPRALGMLRDHLSAAARKRVAVEIAKDCVRERITEIDARLAEQNV